MSDLKKSINLTNAGIIFIFLAFFLDALSDTLVGRLGQTWCLLILVPLHVYIYSGTLGCLAELASGEEMLFRTDNFTKNVKRYFPIYFVLYGALIGTAHFLIKSFPDFGSAETFVFYMRLPMLAVLSAIIIWDKYLRQGQTKGKAQLTFGMVFVLTGLYVLAVLLHHAPSFVDTSKFYLPNLLGFCSQYIFFVSYCFISLIILKQYHELDKSQEGQRELYVINPYPYGGDLITAISYSFLNWHPPIFVILRALTPKNYKIREFNNIAWQERLYKSDILVAITCYTSNSPEAYKIAKEFKKRGSKVVMGGPHVLNMPDEALDYCDSVVIGDVEGVWQEVIKDYENGSLKKTYRGELTEEKFAEVYQELLNSPPEIVKDYLEPTRGCKFKCHFCAVPGNLGESRIQMRPIQAFVNLVDRVRHKFNRDLYFIDSNIYSNPGYAKELFEAIKPLKITWQSASTIDIGKNTEIIKLAKESGCTMLLCGYEIPMNSVEKDKDEKLMMVQKYIEYTRNINRQGIGVKGSFMFGWDSDSWSSLLDLWKFCFKLRPSITALSILTPIPGSKLYWEMLKENRIVNLNWRAYAFYNLVFKHKFLDNYFFPKIFRFVRYLFFFTTSSAGVKTGLFIIVFLVFIFKITS